ncbi:hypothetical protein WMY93_026204 [Mugilogobius chulae]|uniref:Uncharacterized protein n=1 Tax=Mugilogobius chulae TaxID=88201 RepID=A0AAW0N1A7_9GOBI
MREQFQKLRDRLSEMTEQMQKLYNEIQKSHMDKKEQNKQMFLEHFDVSEGDKNLHTLYNTVTGENFSGESVLEIIMNYEEKSRRAVEDFCARLNICFGKEKHLLKEWSEKMQTVQKRMNAVIEQCIISFPKQAMKDTVEVLKKQSGMSCQELAQAILDKLKQKYDWVSWKWKFPGASSENRLNVVVSYSSSPEPVNRERVSQKVLGQMKVLLVPTAELLFRELRETVWCTPSRPKSWPAAPASVLSCTTVRSML